MLLGGMEMTARSALSKVRRRKVGNVLLGCPVSLVAEVAANCKLQTAAHADAAAVVRSAKYPCVCV